MHSVPQGTQPAWLGGPAQQQGRQRLQGREMRGPAGRWRAVQVKPCKIHVDHDSNARIGGRRWHGHFKSRDAIGPSHTLRQAGEANRASRQKVRTAVLRGRQGARTEPYAHGKTCMQLAVSCLSNNVACAPPVSHAEGGEDQVGCGQGKRCQGQQHRLQPPSPVAVPLVVSQDQVEERSHHNERLVSCRSCRRIHPRNSGGGGGGGGGAGLGSGAAGCVAAAAAVRLLPVAAGVCHCRPGAAIRAPTSAKTSSALSWLEGAAGWPYLPAEERHTVLHSGPALAGACSAAALRPASLRHARPNQSWCSTAGAGSLCHETTHDCVAALPRQQQSRMEVGGEGVLSWSRVVHSSRLSPNLSALVCKAVRAARAALRPQSSSCKHQQRTK